MHYSSIRQRRRLLVTCYLTGTELHAWEVLNQTINLWHSSLTVTVPSPVLVFLGRYPYPSLPCSSSFILHLLPPTISSVPPPPLPRSCLLVVHANSHPSLTSPHPSPPQPTSHPFPCGDFWSVKCLSGPATHPYHPLTTPLAEWMRYKRGTDETIPPFTHATPVAVAAVVCSTARTAEVESAHCNLALPGSLPDLCVCSLLSSPITTTSLLPF